MAKILITGGAGFIGSHVADQLLAHGHSVRVLDNLDAQVHGPNARRPSYLHPDIELHIGDVRDADAVKRALVGIEAVYHFAALVGVGQSMYQVARYTDVNNNGTAVLLEALSQNPVGRLIVASSMSVYGEGAYVGPNGLPTLPAPRTTEQMQSGDWETRDASGTVLTPVATGEAKPPALASVYALSKYDQERLCLIMGQAYHIPTVALRFFNAYGTRQALSNPYTGVLAIFAARFLNNRSPLVNEDGHQKRDFVSVHDLARACRLALDAPDGPGEVINVGAGRPITVLEVAEHMARVLDKPNLRPELTGKYRMGDIRHCFSDITLARRVLGYEPQVDLSDGLGELAEWLRHQTAEDKTHEAQAELAARGLAV